MMKFLHNHFIGFIFINIYIYILFYYLLNISYCVLCRLVHSALLPEILNKEKEYAKEISSMIRRNEQEIEMLTQKQEKEMKYKIEQLDVSTTSDDINRLLSEQFLNQAALFKQAECEPIAKKGHQKYAYRNWITRQVDETLFSTENSTSIGNRYILFLLIDWTIKCLRPLYE